MKLMTACFIVVSLLGISIAGAPEPSSQGRSLREWLKALKDPDLIAREEAALVLANLGPVAKAAVPELTLLLKHEHQPLRFQAAIALWKIARQAKLVLPIISVALKEPDRRARLMATQALAQMGKEASAAAPLLGGVLSDSTEATNDSLIQVHCVNALLQMGEPAVPFLVRGLESPYFRTRSLVAAGLGAMGPRAKEAVKPLTRTLEHQDPTTRLLAAIALWRIDGQTETTIPHLIKGLAPIPLQYREQAILYLGEMGPRARAAVPELLKIQKSGLPALRKKAEEALQKIEPDRAKKPG